MLETLFQQAFNMQLSVITRNLEKGIKRSCVNKIKNKVQVEQEVGRITGF